MYGLLTCLRKNTVQDLLNILYESIIYNINLDIPARLNYYITKEMCRKRKCKNCVYDGFYLQFKELYMKSCDFHNIIYHNEEIPYEWETQLLEYEYELRNYESQIDNINAFKNNT